MNELRTEDTVAELIPKVPLFQSEKKVTAMGLRVEEDSNLCL